MEFGELKHLIYTPDLEKEAVVRSAKEGGVDCIPVLDARSAVYMATGICAQNKEPVAVCLDSGNASRSAFSGMTEAYYRNLPVILITFGSGLDYSRELKDVLFRHYVVHTEKQIETLLNTKLPIHIELDKAARGAQAYNGEDIYNILSRILAKDDYLYVGTGVNVPNQTLDCKVVQGGMPGCMDGAIANVLGASLAKKHKRYIGLVSEDEYAHDMNTLGNINVDDSLMLIVALKRANTALESYASSLGFEVCMVHEKELETMAEYMLHNDKKTVLFVLWKD